MINIEAIIVIPEQIRQPLPHEIARGARRLWPHELLETRERPLELWQKGRSKPIINAPTIRKRMGGFAG